MRCSLARLLCARTPSHDERAPPRLCRPMTNGRTYRKLTLSEGERSSAGRASVCGLCCQVLGPPETIALQHLSTLNPASCLSKSAVMVCQFGSHVTEVPYTHTKRGSTLNGNGAARTAP